MLHQEKKKISLCFTQPSMAIIENEHPVKKCNNRTVVVQTKGNINIDSLTTALEKLTHRHEVLRAHKNKTESALTVYNATVFKNKIQFFNLDASHLPASEIGKTESLFSALNSDFFTKPINFHDGPLWRCALIKTAENSHRLIFLFNHIIVDEFSISILLKDLSTYYNAIENNNEANLPEIPSLTNLNFTLRDDVKQKRIAYWKNELNDLNIANLPADHSSRQAFPFPGKRLSFELPAEYLSDVKKQFPKYSNNVIYLATVYTLLYLITNESDLCIGITSSNRRHDNVSPDHIKLLVNAFFNSIPLRIKFAGSDNFLEILKKVEDAQRKALEHQLPIDTIVEEALSRETKNALSFPNPFNILAVLNENKETLNFVNTTAGPPIELHSGWSKMPEFGFNLDINPNGNHRLTMEFNTAKYEPASIEYLFERMKLVFKMIAATPNTTLDNISVLLPQEAASIEEFNRTEREALVTTYPFEYLRHIAFTDPNRLAIQFYEEGKSTQITYADLDRNSTILANHLVSIGVKPGMVIAITLPRSINLYIAVFAIMKAGATFLTLDRDNTFDYKVSVTKIDFFITSQQQQPIKTTAQCVKLANNFDDSQLAQNDVYVRPNITPESRAYIMYTSGTTGVNAVPKGVICKHEGLRNLLNEMIAERIKNKTGNLKILSTAPKTFDAFLYDLLKMLAVGGELHLIEDERRISPIKIHAITRESKLNYAVLLATLMDQLDTTLPFEEIVSMGDIPRPDVLKKWNAKISNGYGLTECGIANSSSPITSDKDCNKIGRPILNTQMLVLNENTYKVCPLNTAGLIYISGNGLAEGYYDQEQNKDRFVWMVCNDTGKSYRVCTENTPKAKRYFATGDYACYRQSESGLTLELMGRFDSQVNINGAKVDLNAVKLLLYTSPLIADVHLKFDRLTGIAAYVVPKDKNATVQQLRKEIRRLISKSLMSIVACPKAIFKISQLPLNINGKVDSRQLTNMIEHETPSLPTYRTELQKQLAHLWAQIMAPKDEIEAFKQDIDLDTTFDELGGSSRDRAKLEILLHITFNLPENGSINFDLKNATIASLEKQINDHHAKRMLHANPDVVRVGGALIKYRQRPENGGILSNPNKHEQPGNIRR